jgi:hypothetical protein
MKQTRKFWTSLTKGTRFQILFYSFTILLGILLFLGPSVFPNAFTQLLSAGLGIALVASSILGFAQRLFFYDDFRSEMTSLVDNALNTYLTKNMLPFFSEGIEKLFSDRKQAVDELLTHISLENDHIVIIGSSLKGLFDVTERDKWKKQFSDLIRLKVKEDVRVEFLLTHPALAFLREDAEGRKPGAIKKEILTTLSYLTGCDFGVEKPKYSIDIPLENIRLYLGTPTIFSIICTERMLINPYAYQATAYENFCFEISKKGEQGLYSKILKSHYKEPWDNKETTIQLENATKELKNQILIDVFPTRIPDLVSVTI